MRRIRLFLLAFTVALGSILWSAGPVSAAADDEVYYLALGDSLAVGYQPRGAQDMGYPAQLYPQLQARNPDLQFVNLGCPGETTSSMIKDSVCGGSQLAKAKDFISDPQGRLSHHRHRSQRRRQLRQAADHR